MKVVPTKNGILVRRLESESKTPGGIIIPSSAQEKPVSGIIVAVGPGEKCEKTHNSIPVSLNVGQKVLFTKWSGTEIKVEGEDLLIMKESDVIAIIED
jgi:chaperonin GroES